MIKLQLRHIYIFFLLISIVCVYSAIRISKMKDTADFVDFSITLISIVVSILAFHFALKTYVSIDSVNAINKMQGNVLENPDYVTSIPSLMKKYAQSNATDVSKAIYGDLTVLYKKQSKSAIEFANNLQYFIDLIVFFPSLFTDSNANHKENAKKMDEILKLIDKRLKSLMTISTGNLLLVEETIQLLKYVMKYQKLVNTENNNIPASILEIRGSLLKNPVSKTIYNNYLGLYYRQKAMDIISKELNLSTKDLLEITSLEEIRENISGITAESRQIAIMYLGEAQQAFDHALESSEQDIMWIGFVSFNRARAEFFSELLTETYSNEWATSMNKAIVAREKLNIILDDLFEANESTFLRKSFYFEEHFAKIVYVNICVASKIDITSTLKQPEYKYPSYNNLLNDTYLMNPIASTSNRIHKYQQQLQQYMGNDVTTL
ncbi:hypothetical protein [uncultured Psychrobacillus sp.]|uniref:hypothetical protein n=1 Tax=uncultured Psychrobacillus sp. TaxID=1551585 RepID=UPI002639BD25|nr:hypothetical protein [uncultured Psychrobacillus sp.]